jgi:hypothetical protein
LPLTSAATIATIFRENETTNERTPPRQAAGEQISTRRDLPGLCDRIHRHWSVLLRGLRSVARQRLAAITVVLSNAIYSDAPA